MASKKPSSTQNTMLQTLGMDVIKQYPGPADSLGGRQGGDVPGKHFPQPAADRQGAQQLGVPVLAAHRGGDHRARYMLKHGNVSAPSAAPSSTSPDPSSSDAAASAAPSSALGLGPPVDLRLTLRRPAP